MIKKSIIIIFVTLISAEVCTSQQLQKLNQKDLKHFSIASELPFKNNCSGISDDKKRTRCLESELRNQVLEIIGKETNYDGEMHLYFTVDKKGNPINIGTKGFPSDPKLEKKLKEAVFKLDLRKGKFKGRKANIRCYTRVFPIEI